jgi:antitoxin HicB
MIRYQAKLEREGEGYWVGFPDLPGCFSEGRTPDQALSNAREALSLYLEEARDEDWLVPTPKVRKSRGYHWVEAEPDVAIPLLIRHARRAAGLSQRQLAARLSMSVQQLQKLECPGKSNPTVRTLHAIARALGARLDVELVA